MKKLSLYTVLFCATLNTLQAQNPFASIGKTTKPMLTLSNGRYEEFFENDSIRQVGSVMVNIRTEKIVAFVDRKEQANKLHSQSTSRFLSLDPLARNFPWNSPYSYAENGPIEAIDLDGLERFKINSKEIVAYDTKTGETKTWIEKQLTLVDITAKFEVIDENDVSMQTFKYQEFACQMQDFTKTNSAAGVGSILKTPNLKTDNEAAKTSDESTFVIKIDNATPEKFNSVGATISTNDLEIAKNLDWGSKLSDAMTNYYDDVQPKYNAVQITNGINGIKTEDIIKNLRDNKVITETTQIKIIENNSGTAKCELGNIDCN